MSCDKGYKGDCCCECKNQLKIHVCNCGLCSTVEGYICMVGHILDNDYSCVYKVSGHGCCELWKRRDEQT